MRSFVSATVRTRYLSKNRESPCHFCGQPRDGAILKGKGGARLCTDCAANICLAWERYKDHTRPMILCPRVFLSYAHESTSHRDWVIELAAGLRARKIAVVYDYDHYRGRYLSSTTAAIMAFIQRMQCCHAFIPIFTPTYLAAIGHGPRPEVPPDKPDPQWVFDEFQLSLQLGAAKRIETIPVLRAGTLDALPLPFCEMNTLDLRTTTDLGEKLNRLAMYLILERFRTVVPYLDETFANFVGPELGQSGAET